MTPARQETPGALVCAAVREHLAEHALGTLRREVAADVRRHVAWCAGCRKEAEDLADGAAAVGLLLGREEPPPRLEDRVVAAVTGAAGHGRRRRMLARSLAGAAAVSVALAGLAGGWAVAMRQRMAVLTEAGGSAVSRVDRFEQPLRDILGSAEGRLLSGRLQAAGADTPGSGRAVVFDSPSGADWVLLVVGGLPEDHQYRAFIEGPGWRRPLGRLWPSAPGELAGYRVYEGTDLRGATGVTVLDADGATVLWGSLGRAR